MTVRPYVAPAIILAATLSSLQAQTTDERLAELEQLIQELRALHDLPVDAVELPVELVGNEHAQWGYPGGACAFLIKEHYVTCHNDQTLVPDWVTYHMTRENLDGDAVRRNNFRPDPELPLGQRAELVDYRNSGFDRGHMWVGCSGLRFQKSGPCCCWAESLKNPKTDMASRSQIRRTRWCTYARGASSQIAYSTRTQCPPEEAVGRLNRKESEQSVPPRTLDTRRIEFAAFFRRFREVYL